MKLFNARHTVSFKSSFNEHEIKETEIAKKQRLLDLTEKQFCTDYCKHQDTPCDGTCKEFEEWRKERNKKKEIKVTDKTINAFLNIPTCFKQDLKIILANLSTEQLENLLTLLPLTKSLTKKCLIEKELLRRKK